VFDWFIKVPVLRKMYAPSVNVSLLEPESLAPFTVASVPVHGVLEVPIQGFAGRRGWAGRFCHDAYASQEHPFDCWKAHGLRCSRWWYGLFSQHESGQTCCLHGKPMNNRVFMDVWPRRVSAPDVSICGQ
jgi:hypothetical protein